MSETQDPVAMLIQLLKRFEKVADVGELREQVLALVPAHEAIRDLGKVLVPSGLRLSARDRLLKYFLAYPRTVISEKELAIVAGISEWARRVRELRVEHGWPIVSGMAAEGMLDFEEVGLDDLSFDDLGPSDYVLLDTEQDLEAAYRWNVANEVRKETGGAKSRLIEYLRRNVGKHVTGEELRYVGQNSEWARRVRELRTEEGWPISTKMSGNPSLPVGVYVLESDRQAPAHDRSIREDVRREVLRRDGYACRECGWTHDMWNRSDPRFLELHHTVPHSRGGENDAPNLVTLCNICHDRVHALDRNG